MNFMTMFHLIQARFIDLLHIYVPGKCGSGSSTSATSIAACLESRGRSWGPSWTALSYVRPTHWTLWRQSLYLGSFGQSHTFLASLLPLLSPPLQSWDHTTVFPLSKQPKSLLTCLFLILSTTYPPSRQLQIPSLPSFLLTLTRLWYNLIHLFLLRLKGTPTGSWSRRLPLQRTPARDPRGWWEDLLWCHLLAFLLVHLQVDLQDLLGPLAVHHHWCHLDGMPWGFHSKEELSRGSLCLLERGSSLHSYLRGNRECPDQLWELLRSW